MKLYFVVQLGVKFSDELSGPFTYMDEHEHFVVESERDILPAIEIFLDPEGAFTFELDFADPDVKPWLPRNVHLDYNNGEAASDYIWVHPARVFDGQGGWL